MKKLILFLLIIPVVSLGQTLYEVDKITDIDYNENVIYPNKKDLLDIYIPRKKKFPIIVFFTEERFFSSKKWVKIYEKLAKMGWVY